MSIQLTVPPKRELKPRIVVFGVGGAGCNAINNMIAAGLEGVDFVVANTDAQALSASNADRRIQIGAKLTEGLGAGSDPAVGQAAAEETMAEIVDMLQGSHMAFVTAGMGGGTGTGAAPVIARAAREQGILTVGVVTKPFDFEGPRRMRAAQEGIEELAKEVDTLIIIPNQNLFRIANAQTTFAEAFAMADEVLHSGVSGITDLMIKPGLVNLDFADVRTVMNEMGKAMMGTGEAEGEKRAMEAAEAAIANPLLDDVSMRGARGVLINITGGDDMTLYEVDEATTRIREEVDPEAKIIFGSTFDESLRGTMRVSVVATGIEAEAAKLRALDGGRVIAMTATAPAPQDAEALTGSEAEGEGEGAGDGNSEEAGDVAAMQAAPLGEAASASDIPGSGLSDSDLPSFLAGQQAMKPDQPQVTKRRRSFIDRVFGSKKDTPEQSAAAMPRIDMAKDKPAKEVAEAPIAAIPVAPLEVAESAMPDMPAAETAPAAFAADLDGVSAPAAEAVAQTASAPVIQAPVEESAAEIKTEVSAEAPALELEAPATEAPKQQAVKAEAPKQEAVKVEAPQVSAPSVDAVASQPMVQTSMDTGPTMSSSDFSNDQLDIPAFLRR
jgi:cell division protein FtsZ